MYVSFCATVIITERERERESPGGDPSHYSFLIN